MFASSCRAGIAFLFASSLGPLCAQVCTGNGRVLKNDSLPDSPSGPLPIAIVPGLCNGEAAMAILNAGGPCRVDQVGIVYAHQTAATGVLADVDVEIYDGATALPNGKYVLGAKLFTLSASSQLLRLVSTGLNVYPLPQPVRVPSGMPVVSFRMVTNQAVGSCQLGYAANFATDPSLGCGLTGKDVLDATGHGPIDPHLYTGFGGNLCPLYFRGHWVIRACVTPEAGVSWTGFPTPGGNVSLRFLAPGQPGDGYVALASSGVASGFLTPWGRLPLDLDPTLLCFLGDCRGLMSNGMGTFNATGNAFGTLNIPNEPVLVNSGFTMYVAFFTYQAPNLLSWKSVSLPSPKIVIN